MRFDGNGQPIRELGETLTDWLARCLVVGHADLAVASERVRVQHEGIVDRYPYLRQLPPK